MPHYDGGGAGDSKDRFYYMDVSNMWDMLQYHDSAPHQQALKGWRQSYELVLMHKTQVEKYKEKLITAWPPERSKASRAYVERLDHLIESLHETFEAAIANYTAYSTAIAAVDDAKRKLETIRQEHAANADALTKYTAAKSSCACRPPA
jgi:DNA repair exonuclease SbcCD ATPase subunit